jgi:hypothetical protein
MSEVVIERPTTRDKVPSSAQPARRGIYKEMVPWNGTVMFKIINSKGRLVACIEMTAEAAPYFSRQNLGHVLDQLDPL